MPVGLLVLVRQSNLSLTKLACRDDVDFCATCDVSTNVDKITACPSDGDCDNGLVVEGNECTCNSDEFFIYYPSGEKFTDGGGDCKGNLLYIPVIIG